MTTNYYLIILVEPAPRTFILVLTHGTFIYFVPLYQHVVIVEPAPQTFIVVITHLYIFNCFTAKSSPSPDDSGVAGSGEAQSSGSEICK